MVVQITSEKMQHDKLLSHSFWLLLLRLPVVEKNALEVFETEGSPIHDLRSGFLFNESKPEDVTSVI